MDVAETLNDFILNNAAAWWVLPVVLFLCFIDGIIPPLPSDAVVVALAAVAVSSGSPNVVLLGLVAAVGAFIGDQTAYTIGRYSPLERLTRSRYQRIRTMMGWAENQLVVRGGVIIIAGRYLPVGRIAVNLTAGMTKYSRLRFIQFDAIAAVSWSIYCIAIGVFAGELFERVAPENGPLLSALSAIVLAVIVGYFVDRVLQRKTDAPAGVVAEQIAARRGARVVRDERETAVTESADASADAVTDSVTERSDAAEAAQSVDDPGTEPEPRAAAN